MPRNARGNWQCPRCRMKTPNKHKKCDHCGRSRRADVGSSYLGRHALAEMGIILPKGQVVPVGFIKVKRVKNALDAAKEEKKS